MRHTRVPLSMLSYLVAMKTRVCQTKLRQRNVRQFTLPRREQNGTSVCSKGRKIEGRSAFKR